VSELEPAALEQLAAAVRAEDIAFARLDGARECAGAIFATPLGRPLAVWSYGGGWISDPAWWKRERYLKRRARRLARGPARGGRRQLGGRTLRLASVRRRRLELCAARRMAEELRWSEPEGAFVWRER